MDGVLLDSEQIWDQARRDVVSQHGGHWREDATAAMQGMSSLEWSAYMREVLAVDVDDAEINHQVVQKVLESYERTLPLMPGAADAVRRIGKRWSLALASSANRVVIEKVLTVSGLGDLFEVKVSSEEVSRGKPYPDVYVEAARRLSRSPRECGAIEDSTNGIRSAIAAGTKVVVIPNRHYPPDPSVVEEADLELQSLAELTVESLEQLDLKKQALEGRVDEEETESFPASDPHSDWAGPPL